MSCGRHHRLLFFFQRFGFQSLAHQKCFVHGRRCKVTTARGGGGGGGGGGGTAARPRIVVIGSGWGGHSFAHAVDKERFDVRVVSPANHFLFTPLLPSTAVGTLEFRAVQEPVRTIHGLSDYYQAKAMRVDVKGKTVTCRGLFTRKQFELNYDFLVIAAGCKTNTFNIPGVVESAQVHFLKHLYHARRLRNRILECFERASSPVCHDDSERAALLRFVVVGGGATSCEFSTELCDFIEKDVAKWYPDLAHLASLHLVEAGANILSNFDERARKHYTAHLEKHGVVVKTKCAVIAVDSDPQGGVSSATLSDGGEKISFGCMIWAAGLAPVKFVTNSSHNIETGKHGRILVDEYLRAADPDVFDVFAIGDCAADVQNPLPPTANVAEQQGLYLAACFNETYWDHFQKSTLSDSNSKRTSSPLPLPKPVLPAAMPFSFLSILNLLWERKSSFSYVERGRMASMGFGEGVADLHDSALLPKSMRNKSVVTGVIAFASWRGAYLSKQVLVEIVAPGPRCFTLLGKEIITPAY